MYLTWADSRRRPHPSGVRKHGLHEGSRDPGGERLTQESFCQKRRQDP